MAERNRSRGSWRIPVGNVLVLHPFAAMRRLGRALIAAELRRLGSGKAGL